MRLEGCKINVDGLRFKHPQLSAPGRLLQNSQTDLK